MGINSPYFLEVLEKYRPLVMKEANDSLLQAFKKFEKGVLYAIKANDYRNKDAHGFLHEIRTYFMLKSLGLDFKMANDIRPGPDFTTTGEYIECVTLGFGNNLDLEIIAEDAPRVGSYNKEGVALRILSAISEKKERYNSYISNSYINSEHPYILFIDYGIMNNSILEFDRSKSMIYYCLYWV